MSKKRKMETIHVNEDGKEEIKRKINTYEEKDIESHNIKEDGNCLFRSLWENEEKRGICSGIEIEAFVKEYKIW
ncbi:MAG: hypothetical protein ACRCZQ_05215 [Bacteroidales bacterium]